MFGFEKGHVQNGVVLVLEIHTVAFMKTDVLSMLALGLPALGSTGLPQQKRDFLPNKYLVEPTWALWPPVPSHRNKVGGSFHTESNCLGHG